MLSALPLETAQLAFLTNHEMQFMRSSTGDAHVAQEWLLHADQQKFAKNSALSREKERNFTTPALQGGTGGELTLELAQVTGGQGYQFPQASTDASHLLCILLAQAALVI